MSDNQENKGCCKNFEDAACPCLDPKTGERTCGSDNQDKKAPDCCGPKGGCCGPQ